METEIDNKIERAFNIARFGDCNHPTKENIHIIIQMAKILSHQEEHLQVQFEDRLVKLLELAVYTDENNILYNLRTCEDTKMDRLLIALQSTYINKNIINTRFNGKLNIINL